MPSTAISAEQRETYERDGYIIYKNFLDDAELEEWRAALCGGRKLSRLAAMSAASAGPSRSYAGPARSGAEIRSVASRPETHNPTSGTRSLTGGAPSEVGRV